MRNQSRNATPRASSSAAEPLAAATIIWAAGVQSSPAAQWLDAPADRVGRLKAEPDLTVPGHTEIFAIGDAAIVLRPDGQPVPGIAPAAKQEGAYVAKVIRARLSGAPAPPPFRYKHAGDLATIGKRRAVIDFGWIKLKGALAWWLWGFAHIYFLIGVRNRLSVAINWLWIYARDQRGARLITWWGGEVEGTARFRVRKRERGNPPNKGGKRDNPRKPMCGSASRSSAVYSLRPLRFNCRVRLPSTGKRGMRQAWTAW